MSKKKFKAGLESLFGNPSDDVLPGIRPLLVEEKEKNKTARKRTKKRSSKNFTSDLEVLFHDALEREYVEVNKETPLTKERDIKKRNDRPIIGLDALIRRTTERKGKDSFATTPLKKRVTFTLEKKKLDQLKSIAKAKKSYLKDIIDEIVSEFLTEYPDQDEQVN